MPPKAPKVLDVRCPQCNRRKSVQKMQGGTYICNSCGAYFDSEPDEGGSYHETDASRRMTCAERFTSKWNTMDRPNRIAVLKKCGLFRNGVLSKTAEGLLQKTWRAIPVSIRDVMEKHL